jgi:hypothetical protein
LLTQPRSAIARWEAGAAREAIIDPLVAVSLDISRYFEVSAQESELRTRALAESIPGRLLQLDLERLSAAG